MLIRKTQQPSTYTENQIHDAYSTSTTDTYSFNLSTTIFAGDNMYYGSRPVTRNSDMSFTFGTNKGVASWNSTNVLTDDSWAVPIKIVGYKYAQ